MRATSTLTAKSPEAAATGELGPGESAQKHPIQQDDPEMHDHSLTVEAEETFASPPGHRPKNCPPGLWCSLVTKTTHPKDPLVRCLQAIKAIDVERIDLQKMGTWDTAHPFKAENAAAATPMLVSLGCSPSSAPSCTSRARSTTIGKGAPSSLETRSKQQRATGRCSRSSATSPVRCRHAGHSSPCSP